MTFNSKVGLFHVAISNYRSIEGQQIDEAIKKFSNL